MGDALLIIKILYYLIFVAVLYLYAKTQYKKHNTKKFGTCALIIFALIFGAYGVICGPQDDIGDRYNYSIRYETPALRESVKYQSTGLYYLEKALLLFSESSQLLFFVISVAYFVINIYCYKKDEQTTPFTLLLLFICPFGLFGFYMLKQAIAIAMMNLAYVNYKNKKIIFSIVCIVIAILFHESSIIALLFFAITKLFKKTKTRRTILYILAITGVLAFASVNGLFVDLFGRIPGMEDQLSLYLNEANSIDIDVNFFTIFKSIPYYIITIFALVQREKCKDKIRDFDSLLLLSVICSAFSLLSLYMYWMWRFAAYCYYECFVLASQMRDNVSEKNNKIFSAALVSMFLLLIIKLLVQYYYIYGGIV